MHRLPPHRIRKWQWGFELPKGKAAPKTSSGSVQVLLHSAGQEREQAEDAQPQEMLYCKVLYLHLKCFEFSCSASCSRCQPRRCQGERQHRVSPHRLRKSTFLHWPDPAKAHPGLWEGTMARGLGEALAVRTAGAQQPQKHKPCPAPPAPGGGSCQ